MENLKLSIPKPCNRSFAGMQPTQDGRFCGDCATEVIDFSKFSTAELKVWFNAHNGKVCGYFNEDQLQKVNAETQNKISWSSFSIKLLLASCFTLVATTKGFSSELTKKNQETFQSDQKSAVNFPADHTTADSLIKITGLIKDNDGGTPIPGVAIREKSGTQTVRSDSNGKFSFQVNAKQNQQVSLVFSYPGYETKEVVINEGNIKNLVVNLNEDTKVMGEVVVVSTMTRWEKVKRFFRRIFE